MYTITEEGEPPSNRNNLKIKRSNMKMSLKGLNLKKKITAYGALAVLAMSGLFSAGVGVVTLYNKGEDAITAKADEWAVTRTEQRGLIEKNPVLKEQVTVKEEVYVKAEVDKQIDAKLQELLKD